MNVMQFRFGDPSQDGHGQFENFFAVVNHSIEEMSEGYAIAEKKFHLRDIANDWEDGSISTDAFVALSEAGFDFKLDQSKSNFLLQNNILYCTDTRGIREIVIFALKKVMPRLELMLVGLDTLDMNIGYGLFYEG